MIDMSQLCFCKQAPRLLLDNQAVCRCKHLVWRPALGTIPSFAPSPFGFVGQQTWTAIHDPMARSMLVRQAKARVGGEMALLPYEDVRDAADAARLAGENVIARDLEYEQWVAGLEE